MSEPRQRWRLIVRRGESARDASHRDVATAWEEAFGAAGLPLARGDEGRKRSPITFGAPVPVGMLAEREVLEILLTERLTIGELRERLLPVLPAGHELVALHDVWLGSAPIAGQVVGADYEVTVVGADPDRMASSVSAFLRTSKLERPRPKAEDRTYDLRPLVRDVRLTAVEARPAGEVSLAIRVRHDPEVGVGRPEEVIAALSELAGTTLVAGTITRTRVWLLEDLASSGRLAPFER